MVDIYWKALGSLALLGLLLVIADRPHPLKEPTCLSPWSTKSSEASPQTQHHPFPAAHLPPTVTGLLEKVGKGKARLNPTVPVPDKLRGKMTYNRETCIGCNLCIKVCPAHAIEAVPAAKKIRIFVSKCIQCGSARNLPQAVPRPLRRIFNASTTATPPNSSSKTDASTPLDPASLPSWAPRACPVW